MERALVLLSLLPFICIYTSPVREKISFKSDDLARIREQENQTTRDPTARIFNFAWRVSYTRTTTTESQTTMAIKDVEKNQEEYQKIFTQLTVTLKDMNYRNMWQNLIKKGFNHFLTEVKSAGPKVMMKDNKDGAFEGEQGKYFWGKIVGFLETMGEKGFELLLNSVDQAPLVTPAAPGAEAAKPAEPPKTNPNVDEPKISEVPPKAEEVKPTEAPK